MEKCKKCGSDGVDFCLISGEHYIGCGNLNNSCWFGPNCDSKEEAIVEWDKIMKKNDVSSEPLALVEYNEP